MARVLLFHHAQGLTAGVEAFADRLRAGGLEVVTPDLFDGRSFESIERGVAHAEEIGFAEVIDRGARAADAISGPTVFAGFSLGVLPAQMLGQTRADAAGALLFHSCLPATQFGTGWPDGVPVQVHAMEADPWFVDDGDLDSARALVAATDSAQLFLYPGSDHLFTDSSLAAHDAESTELLLERVAAFLAAVG